MIAAIMTIAHDQRGADDEEARGARKTGGQTRRMQTPITPGPVWAATTAPTSET